ncbi:hypothetical protein SuNHUV7_00580 (plasmid) [Pseudoseohaeicola sp. NH-UV-7]|uniref:hypothetical protein n=1 Tax=Sulfitobacter sp. TBRI5 TaxID=2989732 RepID=UPI003A6F2A28
MTKDDSKTTKSDAAAAAAEGVALAQKLNEWLSANPEFHLKRSGKEAVIITHHVKEYR